MLKIFYNYFIGELLLNISKKLLNLKVELFFLNIH